MGDSGPIKDYTNSPQLVHIPHYTFSCLLKQENFCYGYTKRGSLVEWAGARTSLSTSVGRCRPENESGPDVGQADVNMWLGQGPSDRDCGMGWSKNF